MTMLCTVPNPRLHSQGSVVPVGCSGDDAKTPQVWLILKLDKFAKANGKNVPNIQTESS